MSEATAQFEVPDYVKDARDNLERMLADEAIFGLGANFKLTSDTKFDEELVGKILARKRIKTLVP